MNLGTIGTSKITGEFINAVKQQGTLQLQAVYSRGEQKAKNFAKTYGAANYFTDLEEMVTSDLLDCIYIASPNSIHFEQVMLFLEHKKHVICEKPIFSNIKEWEEAFRTAEKNGVFLVEAMRNIYMPGFLSLKEQLQKAGKLRSAVLSYSKYSSRYHNVLNGEEPNIFSLNFSGGALVDLGVYPLAAAIELFGKPDQSTYYPVIIRTGVDGGGTLVLQYPGFTCTILCSKITTTFNLSEIQGEKGTFRIDDMGSFSNVKLVDIHTLKESVVSEQQPKHAMYYEVDRFVSMVESEDWEEYRRLKEVSRSVLEVTEMVRKECGIVFGNERK